MATTPTAQTGRNVAAEMRRAGVTQTQIANALGVSQAAVSARLLGRTPIDINELTIIASTLGIPVADLLPVSEAVAS